MDARRYVGAARSRPGTDLQIGARGRRRLPRLARGGASQGLHRRDGDQGYQRCLAALRRRRLFAQPAARAHGAGCADVHHRRRHVADVTQFDRPHGSTGRPEALISCRMTPQQEKEAEWSRWMAAAQDGDRAAYERLLKDCVPYLRSIAGRYHRTADRREDVVQDILLTLHRIRHTYDPARPFTHWLATIASRRSIDALRRRGCTEKAEVFDEQAYETFSDPAANREMSVRDEAPALQAAISTLPE